MRISNRFYKNLLLYFFPFMALLLCLFSKETSDAARKALYLCLDVVIPSLFPFFVLSKLIVPYISGLSFPDFLKKTIEKLFNLPYYTIIIIILGFLSGYPNGAKMSRDMFDQGLLDDCQASRIQSVANNCSPLFIVGTVGAGLLKSVKLGVFLLLIHWISGVIAAYITGKTAHLLVGEKSLGHSSNRSKISENINEGRKHKAAGNPSPKSLSYQLTQSIEEAAILCIKVSGYIIFFAVISELLDRIGVFSLIGGFVASFASFSKSNPDLQEFVSAFSRGILEITSGSQAVSRLSGTTLNMQLAVITLFFGFAGFSVHTQIMGIMKGTGCKYRILFFGKLLHGVIGFILTLAAIGLMPAAIQTSSLESVSNLDFSPARPLIIVILILSLLIAPYRVSKKTYAGRSKLQ
jgi:sporulation integral membrane protein YlbJ